MFAIPAIVLLLVFIYVRPLEFLPELRVVPVLYVFLALALFGLGLDLRLRRVRPEVTPQLPWVIAFFLWCLFTLGVRAPTTLVRHALEVAIAITMYLLVAHAVQTFRVFQFVAGVVVALVLWLAFVGVHQGLSPFGCVAINAAASVGDAAGVFDGRPCETRGECYKGDPDPEAEYLCERVGLVGTTSIGHGRVRYLGALQDPNELALVTAIGVPFVFAFFERKRSFLRLVLLLTTLGLVGACVVFTQSRGGQLIVLATLAAYFVRRFGVRGALLAVALALPLFLLGGRSGEEALSSTEERLRCWYEGMSMVRSRPILGVGCGQFVEHHYQTAHNTYILVTAELGFIGLYLWSAVMFLSLKIPIVALRRYGGPAAPPAARVAATWAMCLVATLIGLHVGITFLSFAYKQVLWVYIGLTAALYSSIRTHDPSFRVKLRVGDAALLLAADLLLVLGHFGYTRLKGGG